MPVYTYTISTAKTPDYVPDATRRHALALDAARLFEGLAGGAITGTVEAQYSTAADAAVHASGTVTLSSGSGTITATINGVAIAITWATSDTVSAALLKTAINASSNALVSGLVTATSAAGVVTITAVNPGKGGNTITLAASGTGATASGARLTAGVGGSVAVVSASF